MPTVTLSPVASEPHERALLKSMILSVRSGSTQSRLGSIALRNTHAYVRVPEDLVDTVIEAMKGKAFAGRDVLIERARR